MNCLSIIYKYYNVILYTRPNWPGVCGGLISPTSGPQPLYVSQGGLHTSTPLVSNRAECLLDANILVACYFLVAESNSIANYWTHWVTESFQISAPPSSLPSPKLKKYFFIKLLNVALLIKLVEILNAPFHMLCVVQVQPTLTTTVTDLLETHSHLNHLSSSPVFHFLTY